MELLCVDKFVDNTFFVSAFLLPIKLRLPVRKLLSILANPLQNFRRSLAVQFFHAKGVSEIPPSLNAWHPSFIQKQSFLWGGGGEPSFSQFFPAKPSFPLFSVPHKVLTLEREGNGENRWLYHAPDRSHIPGGCPAALTKPQVFKGPRVCNGQFSLNTLYEMPGRVFSND